MGKIRDPLYVLPSRIYSNRRLRDYVDIIFSGKYLFFFFKYYKYSIQQVYKSNLAEPLARPSESHFEKHRFKA